MRIAVIGSGISGLSAAYYLSKKYYVDLFEAEDNFGGHSYTFNINHHNKTIPVDLGFIVFNKLTYPNLINFLKELNVPFEKSNMSFSVSIRDSNIEYGGSSLKTLFANKFNILNFKFIKMIKEIISFYNYAPSLLKTDLEGETLGNYLNREKFSKYFIEYHIIPMVAAIWSMPFEKAKDMPLSLFLNFFKNHGLFKIKNRPQWYTITNRSRTYVNKVIKKISGEVFRNYKVSSIDRNDENVKIKIGNEHLDYDQVVLATHADESLRIIKNPSKDEKRILGKFNYVSNSAILHSSDKIMPKRKIAWSSWNSSSKGDKTCITYWLNKLQNLSTDKNYFLTLNPIYEIENKHVIKKLNFTHPYFNLETLRAQKELHSLQGTNRTWYCGSYFGYGFHEDGINSSLNLIKNFKIK